MPYSMIENYKGEYCVFNGEKVFFSSQRGRELFLPVQETVYYETIKIRKGVLVFFEDHMLRLYRSIEAKEAFPFDSEKVYTDAQQLLNDGEHFISDGSLRVIVTKSVILLYLFAIEVPGEVLSREGVPVSILEWERTSPHIKIFHSDYKEAVANAFERDTSSGSPYEILLQNRDKKLTEGSRSNFFVLCGETVYSPPEDLILIGITRKYVKKAIERADMRLEERLFTFEELRYMREQQKSLALFLTSSPFDILPIKSINEEYFRSAKNLSLEKIKKIYHNIVEDYIMYHSPKLPDFQE